MPLYHLHQRINAELVHDAEGSELPDLAAARDECVMAAREMMSAAVFEGFDISGRAFEITDDDGDILLVLPFKLAVAVPC